MNTDDIIRIRLQNQQLAAGTTTDPAEVVAWLGAVQAQDYAGATWALGLRTGATEASVEQAIAERKIVRTWPMRHTLHFVAAADVRWMLALLTPRMVARAAGRYRQLELDDAAFARSRTVIARALRGGKRATRAQLSAALAAGGVDPAGQRMPHILGRLAMDGVICIGPKAGKQQTFVLLDEWIPAAAPPMTRDESLAELARRYFASHGPATLADFAWWSGLTVADAKRGLAACASVLSSETVDGAAYYLAPPSAAARMRRPHVRLLPAYDEYLVAYKDRSAAFDAARTSRDDVARAIFSPAIVIDGTIAGSWTRTRGKNGIAIHARLLRTLSAAEQRALEAEAARYGAFHQAPARLAPS
jgi:hypothetical protein